MKKARSNIFWLATATFFLFFEITACQETGEKKQAPAKTEAAAEYQNGDLIFQISKSSQSQAIQLATHSKYSHCGILYQMDGKWQVFEAVQPVKFTPLGSWIRRGEGGHFVVKRLKNGQTLDAARLQQMKSVGQKMIGKNYDLVFGWSDERIYCSELIWKIYRDGAGLELCPLQRLHDFDLSHPVVKAKLTERYGKNLPLDEPVVPPSALFESSVLETVLTR